MAVRIRKDGTIVCAAMFPVEEGDTYIDDGLHYHLSAKLGVLVTEPMECEGGRGGHGKHGLWWWRDEVPEDVKLSPLYAYVYEGRVQMKDVEPGVGGDVFILVDHPDEYATLDDEFEKWWGEFITCGPPVGPVRITIERVPIPESGETEEVEAK